MDIVDFKAREIYEIKGIRSEERGQLELLWYLSHMMGYHAGTYMYMPTPRTIGEWPGYPNYLVRAENRTGVIVYWGVEKREIVHAPQPEKDRRYDQCKEWLDTGECLKYKRPGDEGYLPDFSPAMPLPNVPAPAPAPAPAPFPLRVPVPIPVP